MANEDGDDRQALSVKTADQPVCAEDSASKDDKLEQLSAVGASGLAAAAARGAVARAMEYDDILRQTGEPKHSLKSPEQLGHQSGAVSADNKIPPAAPAPPVDPSTKSIAALAAMAAVAAAQNTEQTKAPREKDLQSLAVPVELTEPAISIAVRAAQAAVDRARAYDEGNAQSLSFAPIEHLTKPAGEAVTAPSEPSTAPRSSQQSVAVPPSKPWSPRISVAQLPFSLGSSERASPIADHGGETARDFKPSSGSDTASSPEEPARPHRAAATFVPAVKIVTIAPPRQQRPALGSINYAPQLLSPPVAQNKLQSVPEAPIGQPLSVPRPEPDISVPVDLFPFAPAKQDTDRTAQASSAPAPASTTANAIIVAPRETSVVAQAGELMDRADGATDQRKGRIDDGATWRPDFSWLHRALKIGFYVVTGYAALCVALILVYRFVDPPMSNLMLWQRLSGTKPLQQWVPLNKISPNLIKAVIASEDARFCQHGGVDFAALRLALRQSGSRYGRGASTISMQVTKNLFLWNSRSYVRKAIEIPLTMLMELVWPKWRVLEVYLNIAEWGEGVFGAQAAAAYHFSKPARRLSPRQAALLAVLLPNPVARGAADPSPKTRRRAARIVKRVKGSSGAANCVLK